MRIEGRFVWGMLEVTLNGIIFLLLGLFLPNSFTLIAHTGYSIPDYLLIVFGITGTLVALRFMWIYLIFPIEILIARRKKKNWSLPNLKIVSAISFGGIRGAIALAAILSLPTLMPNGSPFPMRELLTIVVVGVVLCSLLLSTIALPLILPTLKKLINQTPMEAENEARVAAAQAGIDAIEKKMQILTSNLEEHDAQLCIQAGNMLTSSLNQLIALNIGGETEKKTSIKSQAFEDALRLAALDGARKELYQLRKKGTISHSAMLAILHRLDLRQIALLTNSTHSQLDVKQ
jgi:monovalent cation/hydrogen antiporter